MTLQLKVNGVDYTSRWRPYESRWTLRGHMLESMQSEFVLDDEDGDLPIGDVRPRKIVEVWEDASGTPVCLYHGRIASKTLGRGPQRANPAMRWRLMAEDANVELRGIRVVSFNRDSETDTTRVEVLRLAYLNGSSSLNPHARDSTTIAGTYIQAGSDTTLEAEHYTDTYPDQMLLQIAEDAGKQVFVYLEDDGTTALFYGTFGDSLALTSDIEINDDGSADGEDVFAPYYSEATAEHDGQRVITGGGMRYGPDDDYHGASDVNSTEATYDKWEEHLVNEYVDNETEADRHVTNLVHVRQAEQSYTAVIDMRAEQVHRIRAGMVVNHQQLSAAKALGLQRASQVTYEPQHPDKDGNTAYRVTIELGRPRSRRSILNTRRRPTAAPIPRRPQPSTGACTRLYFTSHEAGTSDGSGSLAAPSPAADAAWDVVEGGAATMLNPVLQSSGALGQSTSANGNGADIRLGQYLYPIDADLAAILAAGGATVKMQARARARSGVGINEAAQDLIGQAVIRVTQGATATIRGTALAAHSLASSAGSTKWPAQTTLVNRAFPPAAASNALSAVSGTVAGDYLVVEVGCRNFTTLPTGGTLSITDIAASDLPEDETETTDLNSWIDICTSESGDTTSPTVLPGEETPGDGTDDDGNPTYVGPDHTHSHGLLADDGVHLHDADQIDGLEDIISETDEDLPLPEGTFLYAIHKDTGALNNPLHLLSSVEGTTFTDAYDGEALPGVGTGYRDPSIMRWDSAWWIVATGGGSGNFSVLRLGDGEDSWVAATVAIAGSPTQTWAPEWIRNVDGTPFLHPDTGFPCATINLSFDDEATFTVNELHPTNRAMSSWSAVTTITGSGLPSAMIDGYLMADTDAYYLWFKDETNKHIEIAESASLTSGYTLLESGDWASWNANKDAGANSIEGACVIRLPDGRWRIYFNENNGFVSIRTVYSETTDDWRTGTSTWTTQAEITTPELMGHGSVIYIPPMYDHMRDPHAHEDLIAAIGDAPQSFDDLTDVTITSAVAGEMPRWNGSAWVNDSGLICVDPGSITIDSGDPFGVTLTSVWGIDAGTPYYDDTNAAAGEEAALFYDPLTDNYTLIAYDF